MRRSRLQGGQPGAGRDVRVTDLHVVSVPTRMVVVGDVDVLDDDGAADEDGALDEEAAIAPLLLVVA